MASNLRWRGSKQIFEQPGSPDYTENGSGENVVRTWKGPYKLLFSTRPRQGQTMVGWEGYFVEQVDVKPLEAGTSGPGVMTVKLTNSYTNPDKPSDEVEWIEIQKPLEQAPIYVGDGAQALTNDDLDQIAEFRNADSSSKRSKIYVAASAHAKHFINKLRRGQDTYVVYAPVHRRTYRTFSSPSTSKCGHKVTKPATAPIGYEWLRTADRGVRQGGNGKWERVIETTGADDVDEDIYPTS